MAKPTQTKYSRLGQIATIKKFTNDEALYYAMDAISKIKVKGKKSKGLLLQVEHTLIKLRNKSSHERLKTLLRVARDRNDNQGDIE